MISIVAYQHPDIQMLLNKASYLDPRFKTLTHLSSFQQSEVSDAILQEFIELENDSDNGNESDAEREPNNESNDESNDECSTAEPRKKKAKNALLDMMGDSFIVQAAATCTSTHEDMIHAEVLLYKSETTIPLDQYPFTMVVLVFSQIFLNWHESICVLLPHPFPRNRFSVLQEILFLLKELRYYRKRE